MKRCPECGREYDNTMMFCLDDGSELLYGPARSEPGAVATGFSSDEPQTAILHSTADPGEAPTRAQVHTTEQTAIFPRGAEAEPQKGVGGLSEKRSFSANRAAKPLAALIVAVVILVGGFFGYRYFSASSSKQINSIAVMPFENKNSDADAEYLSDGLAESVIFRLTQIPDLRVSPTSSVMRYKGKETDIAKIASELGVDAVMTGRLTKRGDNLNITVELVDARTNKSLWGEQYERKLSELLTTQREIVTEIVGKLQLKLSGESEKRLAKKYTDNNEAYQLYLQGRYHFAKRTKEDILKGIEYFQQAIKLDPNFALAYARISDSYLSRPAYPYATPKEACPPGKAAAMRAVEIDPVLAEGHTFLGMALAICDWNWAEAERELKRGIELDPNSAAAHFRYGQIYLADIGRLDEAIAKVKQALELEPLELNMGGNLAWLFLLARQNDKALEQAKKVYAMEPSYPVSRWMLGEAYLLNGIYEGSIEINEQTLKSNAAPQATLRNLGVAYARSGRRSEAKDILQQFTDLRKTQYVISYMVAGVYAALGDKDQAFAELDRAFDEHDWHLQRIKADPFMDPLRDDQRFKALLKRMGLPE